jgi:tetratricopeptide (TPR) repeat protein
MDTAVSSTAKLTAPPKRGIIFICYRRSDAAGYVGRISEALTKKFKKRHVFRDLEAIAPGTDFSEAIEKALDAASVFILVIGPDWVSTRNSDGQLRLSDPNDYVRREVTSALARKLRIMPVLVGGARIPLPDELPECLREIANFQAFELSDSRWDFDLDRLVVAVRSVVDPAFRVRQMLMALAALVVLIVGAFLIRHLIAEHRIDEIREDVEAGRADQSYLVVLKDRYGKDPADPRVSLYRAEAYRQLGNLGQARNEALKAAQKAGGNSFVAGRAKLLVCQVDIKQRVTQAVDECKDALRLADLAKDDEGHARAMNAIANSFLDNNDSAAALDAYQDVLRFTRTHNLRLDEYGARNNIAMAYQNLGKSDEARDNYKAAAEGFETEKLYGEASNAYNNLGTVSFDQGEVDPAQNWFEKASHLAENSGDMSRLAQAQMNLGLYYEHTGSLDKATEKLNLALTNYTKLERKEDIAFVDIALGDIYLQQGSYDLAKESYEAAAASKDSDSRALAVASLVNLNFQLNQPPTDESLTQLESAIRQAKEQEDSETESFARIVKARLLLRMKKTEDARVEADRAHTQAVNDKQSDNEVAAALILADIKAMHGLLQQALVDLKELNNRTSHKNVIQNLEVRLVTARLMLKYGTAQQRTEAKGRLEDILSEAQGNSHYVLLATEAQASLEGRVH